MLGIVGESGSGKSVSVLAVLGLLGSTADVTGSVRFRDRELLGMPPAALRQVRGAKIAMIFENPVTSLNPVLTVGRQIGEALRVRRGLRRQQLVDRVFELMELVGIPDPWLRADQYPHQLSSGMCQRVMIAMAVADDPELLIADEPTASLDVTVQGQVLDALRDVREALGMAMILITHDLAVVAGQADDVAVMYCGRVVERAAVDDLYHRPRHPYTRGLLAAIAPLDDGRGGGHAIGGTSPGPSELPSGCSFHPRCPHARPRCSENEPELRPIDASDCACHFAEDLG